jgi:hypothetical protein
MRNEPQQSDTLGFEEGDGCRQWNQPFEGRLQPHSSPCSSNTQGLCWQPAAHGILPTSLICSAFETQNDSTPGLLSAHRGKSPAGSTLPLGPRERRSFPTRSAKMHELPSSTTVVSSCNAAPNLFPRLAHPTYRARERRTKVFVKTSRYGIQRSERFWPTEYPQKIQKLSHNEISNIDSLREEVSSCSVRLVASFTRLSQPLASEFYFYPATSSSAWFQNSDSE